MPAKKIKVVKKDKEYEFLTGCDLSDGRRFEKGDSASDIDPEDVKELLKMDAIKEVDGDN